MRQINISLNDQLITEMIRYCHATGLTRSDVIRRAVEEYMRNHAPRAYEGDRKDDNIVTH